MTQNRFCNLIDTCDICDFPILICCCSKNLDNRLHSTNVPNSSIATCSDSSHAAIYDQSTIIDLNSDESYKNEVLMSKCTSASKYNSIYDQSTTSELYEETGNPSSISVDSILLNDIDINEDLDSLQEPTSSLELRLTGKGLHIGHLNVNGIRSKFPQVEVMLKSEENDIAIFGVTESKLGPNQPDAFFYIEGYKMYRKDKIESSGGVIIYVRNDIVCNRREDLETDQIEMLLLEVFPKGNKSFIVGITYRNPNSNVKWNEDFENQVEHFLDEQKEIILLGDFNKDLLNPTVKSQWCDYMTSFGLVQCVKEATRVIENRSKSLIDHIYTNQPDNIIFVDIPHIAISDHFPTFITRKINCYAPKKSHYTIKYRCFKHFDVEEFKNDLLKIPWDVIRVHDKVDDAMETWYNLFNEVLDKHVPLKQHRVKRPNQPNWLTPEIIEAMKERDRYKSLGDEAQYRNVRNYVTKLIKLSKKRNYQNLIDDSQNSPGNIWKIFKEFGAGKGKHKTTNIFTISVGDEKIEDSKSIANEFNNYFISIADRLKEPIENASHDKLREFCKQRLPLDAFFKIPLISVEKVLKYLKTLDISKSTGCDNVGPRLLKIAAPFISDSLAYLCNLSFRSGEFPSFWKCAKVKPLHKSGACDDVNNYRPISILPVLSKLIEKHVHDAFMSFLNEYDLLYVNQSGFRPKHSCETALISMVGKWLQAVNDGKLIGVVLVDFRKAFDLVDHKILIEKLKEYQLDDYAIDWFRSYLEGRVQYVDIDNVSSDDQLVTCGVPQGSILGPLLFLLFINDLPLHTTNVSTDLYADDTTLYDIGKSKPDLERNLSIAVTNLSKWCTNNGMVINYDKTKMMLITTKQKRALLEYTNLNISINSHDLACVSGDKILGVHVDDNLLWTNHIDITTKKLSRNIWLLSQISKYLPIRHRVTYYKSYIQPHIDYCNIIWANANKSGISKIERLQRRACKIIMDYNYDNVLQTMADLNIMTIHERAFLRTAKFMYKVSNGTTPMYINELFSKRNSNGEAMPLLRSITSNNFLLPKPNINLYRNSLLFNGPVIWNCLPRHVKMAPSVDSFHKKCISWMKDREN